MTILSKSAQMHRELLRQKEWHIDGLLRLGWPISEIELQHCDGDAIIIAGGVPLFSVALYAGPNFTATVRTTRLLWQ